MEAKGISGPHCFRRSSDRLEVKAGAMGARVSSDGRSALNRFDPIRTDERRIANSDVFSDALRAEGQGKPISHKHEAIPESDFDLVSGTGDPSDKERAQAAGSNGPETIAKRAPRSTRSTLFVYLGLLACCVLPVLLLTGTGVAMLSSLLGFGLWLALAFATLVVVFAIYAVSRHARGSQKMEEPCC